MVLEQIPERSYEEFKEKGELIELSESRAPESIALCTTYLDLREFDFNRVCHMIRGTPPNAKALEKAYFYVFHMFEHYAAKVIEEGNEEGFKKQMEEIKGVGKVRSSLFFSFIQEKLQILTVRNFEDSLWVYTCPVCNCAHFLPRLGLIPPQQANPFKKCLDVGYLRTPPDSDSALAKEIRAKRLFHQTQSRKEEEEENMDAEVEDPSLPQRYSRYSEVCYDVVMDEEIRSIELSSFGFVIELQGKSSSRFLKLSEYTTSRRSNANDIDAKLRDKTKSALNGFFTRDILTDSKRDKLFSARKRTSFRKYLKNESWILNLPDNLGDLKFLNFASKSLEFKTSAGKTFFVPTSKTSYLQEDVKIIIYNSSVFDEIRTRFELVNGSVSDESLLEKIFKEIKKKKGKAINVLFS